MSTPRAQIVHVLPLLEWSGAEKVVAELALRLPAHGFATSVLGLESDQTDYAAALRADGISVSGLNLSRRRTLACARALRAAILPLPRPLIVHAHMFHATLAARWAARELVRNEAVRVVSTTHIVERRFRPWHSWLDRWTAAAAACEICVSQAVRAHQMRSTGLPAGFFRVIENGIPLDRFTTRSDPALAACEVVSVGRLDPQKDFSTLLHAWRKVEDAHASVRLRIAGRGPEEAALRALAARLGLQRVEFLGFVEDIPSLLCGAQVYVQSSRWEGFGLAVAEAMAAGVATVVSNVDSLPEIVRHDVTGQVVEAGNAAAFAAAILELLADVDLRRRLSRSACEEALRRFDVRRMVAEHATLYDEILARKGATCEPL